LRAHSTIVAFVAFTLDRYGHLYPDNGDDVLACTGRCRRKIPLTFGGRLGARNRTHHRHEINEDGGILRIEGRRVINYGVTLMLSEVTDWRHEDTPEIPGWEWLS
jgi:hypothetical protein